MHSRGRKTSLEGGPFFSKNRNPKAKNQDLLPGLPYFALATDIIGNQLGGNSLQHVHANILAGLFHACSGEFWKVMLTSTTLAVVCKSCSSILSLLAKLNSIGNSIGSRN
jgi:hypothetical protein